MFKLIAMNKNILLKKKKMNTKKTTTFLIIVINNNLLNLNYIFLFILFSNIYS